MSESGPNSISGNTPEAVNQPRPKYVPMATTDTLSSRYEDREIKDSRIEWQYSRGGPLDAYQEFEKRILDIGYDAVTGVRFCPIPITAETMMGGLGGGTSGISWFIYGTAIKWADAPGAHAFL